VTEAASSDGSDITRMVSRERVSLIESFEGKIVAMYAPLGLGRDCEAARRRSVYENYSTGRQSSTTAYTSMCERIACWRTARRNRFFCIAQDSTKHQNSTFSLQAAKCKGVVRSQAQWAVCCFDIGTRGIRDRITVT